MPGIFAQPVGYQGVALAADYLTGPRQFEVSKLAVTAQGFALDASGTLTLNDAGSPGIGGQGAYPGAAGAHPAALLAVAGGAGRARLDRHQYLRRHHRAAGGADQFHPRHAGPGHPAGRLAEADLRA